LRSGLAPLRSTRNPAGLRRHAPLRAALWRVAERAR